jgi:hypothetical protein
MAKRDDSNRAAGTGEASASTVDSMEQKMLALAEQLGRIIGTVQAKAEGWLDRDALSAQVSTIRDSASDLLTQLGGGTPKAAASRPAPASGTSRNAGASAGKDAGTTKAGAKGKGSAKDSISTKGRAASKVRASSTSGATSTKSGGKARSGGAVDAPGKKHRKPMPSESGATGTPRGEGSRIAKLKAVNQNRVRRRG